MSTITITALHGMLGEPTDWDFLRSALGPRFTFESPDLFTPSWSIPLDKIGSKINTASSGDVLLGYSMGARLALHALTEQPTRWHAAILISPHPGLENESDRLARLQADQTWATKARTGDWSNFLDSWNNQPIFADTKSPDRLYFEPKREAIADAFTRWSLARQKNFLPQFPNTTTPILWLTGANDQKFTSLATIALQHLPQAQHEIIPAANHRPQIENPLATLTSLQNFLLSPTD